MVWARTKRPNCWRWSSDVTTYYKATRPDGRDFYTGTIDYGAALLSGEVVRHPGKRKVRNQPATYLSMSVSAADCTGFSWPCRLFRVEPIGRVGTADDLPSKRTTRALRVVEELPAWQAFGPNAEAVVALIARARTLTPDEARRLVAAGAAACGLVVRDLITPAQFDALYGPWASVMETM